MTSTLRYGLVLLLVLALLSMHATNASNSRPPRNNDISNMADAIKYLQDLDSYYGDRARSRFGKRAPLLQLLRNHLVENGDMARPIEYPNIEEPF